MGKTYRRETREWHRKGKQTKLDKPFKKHDKRKFLEEEDERRKDWQYK